MDTKKCFNIPLKERIEATKYFDDLYDGIDPKVIDPDVMEMEGGGKRPHNDTDFRTSKKSTSGLEPLLYEMGFEETLQKPPVVIRRSERLRHLKRPYPVMSGGTNLTEEEKKAAAIENTQMMTFGIISAIIIGTLVSPEHAEVILQHVKTGGKITIGYLQKILGKSWNAISEQISNFGNAYWKQSGNPSICTTGMDTVLDTAMRFPLISGYIGGDGYWKSCATRLAERDDRAMALWALAQKTFVNAAGVVGAGTFIAKYGTTFAGEEGMSGVIQKAKEDLKSLFTVTKRVVKNATYTIFISPFSIAYGIVGDFMMGGMLISKKILAGTKVYVDTYKGKQELVKEELKEEKLMSVPTELVTAVDKESEHTGMNPGTDTGTDPDMNPDMNNIDGGKRRRRRTKSKTKRRGKSKKNRRKKSYKKRNKKH